MIFENRLYQPTFHLITIKTKGEHKLLQKNIVDWGQIEDSFRSCRETRESYGTAFDKVTTEP